MTVTCPNCGSEIAVPRYKKRVIKCSYCNMAGLKFGLDYFDEEDHPRESFWTKHKGKIIAGIIAAIIAAICAALAYNKCKKSSTDSKIDTEFHLHSTPNIEPRSKTSATPAKQPAPSKVHTVLNEVELRPVEPVPKTDFEKHLLERLTKGELDGPVGTPCTNQYGSSIWYGIEDGTIKKFKQGPTKRVFDGKETEKIIPDWKVDQKLKSEDEQLNFLRRSGRYMKDPEVQAYSDQYWNDFWKKKYQH